MLPWENLPVLKNHEVYRMPSVWSISAAYRNGRKINPLEAYYLLNPDGNLNNKDFFEKLFRDNKLKVISSFLCLLAQIPHAYLLYIPYQFRTEIRCMSI